MEGWCNGNTLDFESNATGSTPVPSANNFNPFYKR